MKESTHGEIITSAIPISTAKLRKTSMIQNTYRIMVPVSWFPTNLVAMMLIVPKAMGIIATRAT